MKKRLTFILSMVLLANLSYSQLIDRYGINIGATYSTQIWDYKLVPIDSDNEYKFGLQAFLQAEKDFGNILAVRTEFGYLQKGFKNNLTYTFSDGTPATFYNDNVVLHDLALNLALKVKLLKSEISPYLLVGFRGDYMISYKDIEIEEPSSGLKFNMYESTIEEFNKFNVGGLIGLGINLKKLFYFEIEYNPNITKNLDNEGLSIRDNCWGAKIGLNINKLFE